MSDSTKSPPRCEHPGRRGWRYVPRVAQAEPSDDHAAPLTVPGTSLNPGLREMVGRAGAAWNDGELDALLALADADFEFSPELDEAGRPLFPGLEPLYRGHEDIRQHLHEWRSVFEGGVSAELIGVVYGTDCVVTVNRFQAVGREGVATGREIASAIQIRDGLIWRWHNFAQLEDALRSLGMPADLVPGPP